MTIADFIDGDVLGTVAVVHRVRNAQRIVVGWSKKNYFLKCRNRFFGSHNGRVRFEFKTILDYILNQILNHL